MLATMFMHVHVPRTAGTTLRAVLDGLAGVEMINSGAHQPYGHMAEECRRKGMPVPPAFAVVRNPYSWYVSQWAWLTSIGQQRIGQETTFRQYMELVKENASLCLLNFSSMSSAWRYLQADRCQYYPRFEGFPGTVVEVLVQEIGLPVSAEVLHQRIREAGAFRRVPKGDYRQFYEDDLKEWVAEWDAELLERFGYE